MDTVSSLPKCPWMPLMSSICPSPASSPIAHSCELLQGPPLEVSPDWPVTHDQLRQECFEVGQTWQYNILWSSLQDQAMLGRLLGLDDCVAAFPSGLPHSLIRFSQEQFCNTSLAHESSSRGLLVTWHLAGFQCAPVPSSPPHSCQIH